MDSHFFFQYHHFLIAHRVAPCRKMKKSERPQNKIHLWPNNKNVFTVHVTSTHHGTIKNTNKWPAGYRLGVPDFSCFWEDLGASDFLLNYLGVSQPENLEKFYSGSYPHRIFSQTDFTPISAQKIKTFVMRD